MKVIEIKKHTIIFMVAIAVEYFVAIAYLCISDYIYESKKLFLTVMSDKCICVGILNRKGLSD